VWSEEWQRKLSASLEDLQTGRLKTYDSGEEFLEAL
jgi:hypothetical protein